MSVSKYSKENLQLALVEINAAGSIRKVSVRYGIPKSTLSDHKLAKFECGEKNPNKAITTKEEEALVSYIVWMADYSFPLTRSIMKCLALAIPKRK